MKAKARSEKRTRRSPSLLERVNPNAAGIDCGSAEHYVAVPGDRDPEPVRHFKTFTEDLQRLADWLVSCGIRTVAMEATGVYWIPIYAILEGRGIEVLLVSARHVKNVPGRKSDVTDCEWLQQLHSVGLLRGSFRPTAEIAALRSYLRHRETLVQSAATAINRMQKALVQMNLLPSARSRRKPRANEPHFDDPNGTSARGSPWRRTTRSREAGSSARERNPLPTAQPPSSGSLS